MTMAYFNRESQSQQLNAEISAKFQGTARISLACLSFDADGEWNEEKANRLVEIFRREGCDRSSETHAITAAIAPDLLAASLQESNLTAADLRAPQSPFLRVPTGMRVHCLHGRHRVEALRRVGGLAPWWTVKIYSNLSSQAAKLLADDFANEGRYSDGHIVVKIRSYPPSSPDANRWWTRLSKSKPEILRRLFKHAELGPALCSVLDIPGLRPGLQLAIWKKIMAENATEEVVHYLQRVYDTWRYIVGPSAALDLVDEEAVRELELRVPVKSQCDDLYVSHLVRTYMIFRKVTDEPERERILERLQ